MPDSLLKTFHMRVSLKPDFDLETVRNIEFQLNCILEGSSSGQVLTSRDMLLENTRKNYKASETHFLSLFTRYPLQSVRRLDDGVRKSKYWHPLVKHITMLLVSKCHNLRLSLLASGLSSMTTPLFSPLLTF